MATSTPQQTLPSSARQTVVAMYTGLALTVIALLVPFIDVVTTDTLGQRIQQNYPSYSPAEVSQVQTIFLSYLAGIGALGVVSWLWMVRVVRNQKPWAGIAATLIFLCASSLALTNLFISEGGGATALPTMLGVVGVLPCAAGLVAVVLLWKRAAGSAAAA